MQKRIIEGVEVQRSSGNVYADLGLPDADKLKIKTGLVIEIRKAMRTLGLNQQAAAARMGIRHIHEAQGGPGEILFRQFEAAQRITHMGIKARRNDHQIRCKRLKRRENDRVHGLAKFIAAIPSPQRCVEDISDTRFTHGARARIERHLVR